MALPLAHDPEKWKPDFLASSAARGKMAEGARAIPGRRPSTRPSSKRRKSASRSKSRRR
jgi:hypothetical protein